jgi:4-amino-4-deoxy-L-arabinose transferase-like glycosyltransferase
LLLFAVQAISAVRTKSATWDEVNYFGMGDYLLRSGRWDVPSAVIHPPLAYYLDSVPLLVAPLDRSVWTYPSTMPRDRAFLGAADSNRGQALLSSPANRDDRLLTLSRVMVVLQALLLGFFVYRFGSAVYGETGGILAAAFFAFCPNMLAHGALITPDMTVTVFSFITVYYFRAALLDRRPGHFVIAGIFLGLALLSKFTAVLLIPVEAVMIAAAVVMRPQAGPQARPASEQRLAGRTAVAASAASVKTRSAKKTGAARDTQETPGPAIPVRWLLASLACAALVFLAAYRFNPAPYFQGLSVQGLHGAEGHTGFLFGQLSKDGWWYYCLVAFVLKTPVPLLLCVVAALVLLARDGVSGKVSFDAVALWLPVVVVFAFFSVELRSIGLRYVLPAYPFIFVLAAGALLRLPRPKYLCAVAFAWFVLSSALAWPHYLAYFNETIGGADNGYRYLVDSNLDWGQDLKGLKQYMDSHGLDRINLSYFGLDSPARYGIRYDWLPSYELKNPNPRETIQLRRAAYVAISVTNLQGVYMQPPTMFRWLDRYTPIARIGHTIFIYRLE